MLLRKKELRLLNRILRWTEHGISWEPDPRHVELILPSLDLSGDDAKLVVTPGSRESTRRTLNADSKEEYLCEECNLVHAYGVEPVVDQDGLRNSTTSAVSSRRTQCSTTSRASCRRTPGDGHQFCGAFDTCSSCDGSFAGSGGVQLIRGQGGCSDDKRSWTRLSPTVLRKR